MSTQITELTFLRQLAHRFDLPVPDFLESGASRAELREALESWGGKGIVKPDIMSGGRGHAGVVEIVDNAQDALKHLKRISAAEVRGMQARTSYISRFIESNLQIYSAFTYDSRYLGPSLTLSLKGGEDIEEVGPEHKKTVPVDVFKGLDAYEAANALTSLDCPADLISIMSQKLVSLWDMFISTGLRMCEVNPWRIDPSGKPFACDFKGIFDEANFKLKNPDLDFPEYPENVTEFEEDMNEWSASSHRGQAHVSDLGGNLILPILFGGGASTIIAETLDMAGGSPIFLSDFGGNPPYERMYGTAERCFKHYLAKASLLLILGGKANNTAIDVTFRAIADALTAYFEHNDRVEIPVVIGRGGPGMVPGFIAMREALDSLRLPYVIFGHDTPITLVAEYAAKIAASLQGRTEVQDEG